MRVLIPYDGSTQSKTALEYVSDRHSDDEIVLLHVLDFVEMGYGATPEAALAGNWDEWYDQAEESAMELLSEAAETLETAVETEIVTGSPARAIIEYIDDGEIDAVVIGSHGRDGLSRILLGSVAETVVRRSPVPVTVVR